LKRLLPALLAVALLPSRGAHSAPRKADLIITNGTLVTVDKDHRVIPDGSIAVAGGAILGVGQRLDIARDFTGAETLDAGGGLVIPGLINAHTHAPMVLFRGIADDLKLMDWLQRYIFPAEARNVNAEFVREGSRLAALEMIRSGTTTFVDMYYFENEVAEATRQAGLRAVLGATLIDFPAPDHKTPAEALVSAQGFLARFQGDPRIVPALAPHSTYLCSPEILRRAAEVANPFQAPILIHLSESQAEQEQIRERYGKTPTEHLRDLGLLRKGLLGAHGCWLTKSDLGILKAAGAGIAHCPESNMKLASGAAPVAEMLREGLPLGLGTDGAASNNDLDMFEEMLAAALLAKHVTGDPTAAPAQAVLEMATLGGARALGLDERIGSLEVGKRADIVVVGLQEPRLHPLYDPVSHLVYAAKGADVQDVVVEGKVIMRARHVLTLDEPAIVATADRLRDRISATLHP
jgi:5-methylthioadenosine/S-adenosylhomocysteine deaminase